MEGIDFQELNRTQHQQMITLSFKDRRIKEQETIKVKRKSNVKLFDLFLLIWFLFLRVKWNSLFDSFKAFI